MAQWRIRAKTYEDTVAAGKALAARLKKGDMVALYGGLGAGKTAFTRGVVQGLGGADEVSSPTFAIVNEYDCPGVKVYHFDVYRLQDEEDLYSTGFYEMIEEENSISIIEWSENIPYAIAADAIRVSIYIVGDTPDEAGNIERQILIEGRNGEQKEQG